MIQLALLSIPSPERNTIGIGPLEIHYYGIAIALGVIAAISLASRRFMQRGGDRKLMERAGIVAVGLGILGARLAYVSTHTAQFRGRWHEALYIWQGGLAFFGGLAGGAIGMLWVMGRARANTIDVLDSVAPAIPLAQAIGRWGNYFNQELFGRPTDLPWALEIDVANRPARYADFATFHPTFLYESLWNFGVVAALLLIERRFRVPKGGLFFLYLIGYGIGRFWLELLRVDTTYRLAGISRNGWVSVGVVLIGFLGFGILHRRQRLGVAV